MTHDGMIQHPESNVRGHIIKPSALIRIAEERAFKGCGLHDDLYFSRIQATLDSWYCTLSEHDDKVAFLMAASAAGYRVDSDALENQCAAARLGIDLETDEILF